MLYHCQHNAYTTKSSMHLLLLLLLKSLWRTHPTCDDQLQAGAAGVTERMQKDGCL